MNRFAALDSDNDDDQPKTSSVTVDKKKKKEENPSTTTAAAASTKPGPAKGTADSAQAPKKASDSKPKTDGKRDSRPKAPASGQKNDKPKSAPEGATGGEVAEVSGSGKGDSRRDQRSFGKGPKTRYEKRQDENDPSIKPDNRIRGAAHGKPRRHPSKNAEREEADGLAREGEKDPNTTETVAEPVEGEEAAPEAAPVEPAEPEPVTLTLEEYQRQREAARASSALLANQKAARAVEALTGMKVKEDNEGPDVYTGTAKSSKAAKSSQRSTAKTVITDLGFKVESDDGYVPREDRRTPNGRNPGRGYSKGPRGPRVDISDVNAFPAL